MDLILRKAEKKEYKTVKKLYLSAFPREERQPFFIMKHRDKRGGGSLYYAEEEGSFVGFAYVIPYGDTAYLFYFAVDSDLRGKGYGSRIIAELKEIYKGKRFFLARETLCEDAENYRQRVKRHEFYLKNGFSDLPLTITEAGVTFDVMGIGGEIEPEEYSKMMERYCGRFLKNIIGFYMDVKK